MTTTNTWEQVATWRAAPHLAAFTKALSEGRMWRHAGNGVWMKAPRRKGFPLGWGDSDRYRMAPEAPVTRTVDRSARREVRNPILALPAAQQLQQLPPEARDALVALLGDLQAQARAKANDAWRTHKPPMAAYWAACSTYAGHIKRVVRS